MRVLKPAPGEVLDVAFSPDCRAIAAAVDGAGVFLWNLDSPNIAPVRLEAAGYRAGGLCFSDTGRRLAWPRGKVLGGSSCLNAMVWVRGAAEDFDTLRVNSPVQGTGADGLKLALAFLWERRHQCPGAFPVLVIHDEIVVEAGEGQKDAAAGWLKRAMLDGMAPLIAPVRVEVEVRVGKNWAAD